MTTSKNNKPIEDKEDFVEEALKELKDFEMIVPDGHLKDCLVYHECTMGC